MLRSDLARDQTLVSQVKFASTMLSVSISQRHLLIPSVCLILRVVELGTGISLKTVASQGTFSNSPDNVARVIFVLA